MSATDSATPVVSVCMITYNHERFIAQAIESVLMQETDFPVELVIGEDCSTDGTRAIVVEYAQRHPDRIRPLLRERNLGMIPNFVATLQACRGKYIALLEGDDYWTDPHKLQKQVEFLEGHPECSMCFHDVMVVYEDQQQESHRYCSPDQKTITTLEDLLVGNFIATCSVVFRHLSIDFPEWFYQLSMGDWALHILNAQRGHVGYIGQLMGAYRVHPGGVWSATRNVQRLRETLKLYGHLDTYLDLAYKEHIRSAALRLWDGFAAAFIQQARDQESPRSAIASAYSELEAWPSNLRLTRQERDRLMAKVHAGLAFDCYHHGDLSSVRWHAIQAVLRDAAWLRNRGFLSVTARAFLGRRNANGLRQLANKVAT